MLKLPRDASLVHRERFEKQPTRRLEAAFFKTCCRLILEADKAEALYRELRARRVHSEPLWQGVHGLHHAREKLRKFGIVPFNEVLRRVAETETP